MRALTLLRDFIAEFDAIWDHARTGRDPRSARLRDRPATGTSRAKTTGHA
ncbi:hypothetical protein GN330_08360 [Nitratireductor sp. CAU 1489]|uniref:Uncharacterized protein n=1 Tax=Nitratireductor arenosus TaxID=2682096 RepID=A0A844QGS6_9HYPH|nr:hypothetical protein [Nitratireductor arenosus]MVA97258.1 hypothetical protein [Nitratireductor arenosus]